MARIGLTSHSNAVSKQHFMAQWWLSLFIATLILLLNLIPGTLADQFKLIHKPISNGEYWRLYTCHFLHLGINHTLLNLAGYILLNFSFREEITAVRETVIIFMSASSVGIGLFLLNPEIYSYVGLSGVIYGIISAYLIIGFNKTPQLSLLFFGFLLLKFYFEISRGSAPAETEALIGGKVAIDSHLYGAIGGIAPGVYYYLKDKYHQRERTNKT